MKTGIIFDLDGTLWDSTENIANSWNDILKNNGYEFTLTKEQVANECGKVMKDVADSLFSQVEVPIRYDLLDECMKYENDYLAKHGGELFDGIEDVLKELHEIYNLSIVSNCQLDYVKCFTEYFNFGKYLADYEEAGRTGKPKSDNIKLVIERNHLDKAFYVGDTLGDMKASDEAGIPFIHAAYGFGNVPDDRMKIDDIRELPDLIYRLLERENKCEN